MLCLECQLCISAILQNSRLLKKLPHDLEFKDHKTVEMDLSRMLTSALTNPDLKVPTELTQQIPITYVPARTYINADLSFRLGGSNWRA
jgi:7-cyano-7-deazaguanine synthase in queuosine biosynthesis